MDNVSGTDSKNMSHKKQFQTSLQKRLEDVRHACCLELIPLQFYTLGH